MAIWRNASWGLLAGLGSGISFSLASVVAKLIFAQGIGPWALTALSSLLALPLLLPCWRGGDWRAVIPAGIAGSVSMLLYNVALARLDLTIAVLLTYTFPTIAILLVWTVRGRRPDTWQLAACALSLLGVAVVSGPPGDWATTIDMIGALAALTSAIAHGAFALLGERLTQGGGARAVLLTSLLTVLIPVLVAPAEVIGSFQVPAMLWALFALSAVVARVVPLWLFSIGSRLAGAGLASLAATIELPLSLLIGVFLLHEELSTIQWAGAAAIILSLWLTRLSVRYANRIPDLRPGKSELH